MTSVVLDELWVHLLARERELDRREGTIVAWEDGLAFSMHALGRACMECGVERTQAEVVWQDFLARMHTSPLTLTGCWRNDRSSFLYRRQT
jgi:hypothetical protein